MISTLSAKYKTISRQVVFFCMLLIAVSLFFSRFLLSVGFILVVLNWFFEGGFKQKFTIIKQNRIGFYIVFLLLFHLIGLIYTKNIVSGLNDVRIKSFLLIIVAYGSGTQLSDKQKDTVFHAYILSALLASVISSLNFYIFTDLAGIEDLAGMSLVGGNLFQAFMIDFAIGLLCYYLFLSKKKKYRFIYFTLIVWFVFYLFLLNALTGYVIFVLLAAYNFFYFFFRIKNSKKRLLITAIFLSASTLSCIYLGIMVNNFYKTDKIDYSQLQKTTTNGNEYFNDTIDKQHENGNFIKLYLCEKELQKEWDARSGIDYFGKDKKQQQLAQTLIRYLSSKNLRKDSVGVWALHDVDIKNIENGYANYLYADKFSLKARLYIVFWQLDKYFKEGFADRQTISQRIVYIKVAARIIREHFWLGVGPGDVLDVSKKHTKLLKAGIGEKYTSRVHNQFLLEFVGLGIFGFIGFIVLMFFPYLRNKMWSDYLFTTFYLVVFIGLFIDVLFDAQLGIAFFAYFYALLFFKQDQLNK